MSLPRSFWVFLGVAEIAAAIGLTLPGLTRVMPFLVSWAAVGIMIVMISATAITSSVVNMARRPPHLCC